MKKTLYPLPLILFQIIFLIIPFILLFRNNTNISKIIDIGYWLIQNNYFNILFYTFKTSFLISIVCLIISYCIAYCMASQKKNIKNICIFLFFIPFISNFLMHILSIINLFYKKSSISFIYNLNFLSIKQENLLYSQFLMYIGYIYCFLPYSFIPIYNAIEKFDKTLYKASADLGATFWQTIFKIVIPNTKKAIITSFFLVFIASSGEFIISEILGGDKYMHAGSIISYSLLNGNLTQYSIVMILFFVFSLILLLPLLYQFILIAIHFLKKT